MWNQYLVDASWAGKLYSANGYQHSLSEWRAIIKWDYTGVWQHSLVFVNDLVTRKCALIEFARGRKLGEAMNRLEHTPTFKMTVSHWGNILEKAESSFSKMQIPEAKEVWESTKKNCGDGGNSFPPPQRPPCRTNGESDAYVVLKSWPCY